MVYAQAMLAILGALSLEQGAVTANKIVKDRVLRPLGLYKQEKGEDLVDYSIESAVDS